LCVVRVGVVMTRCVAFLILFLATFCSFVSSRYLIVSPRKWLPQESTEVCVLLESPAAADDSLVLSLESSDQEFETGGGSFGFNRWRPRDQETPNILMRDSPLILPTDNQMACTVVSVPNTQTIYGRLNVTGKVAGIAVNESGPLRFASSLEKTFIQTDKYLYKPGQMVEFRVLTLSGPYLKVSTEPYAEIYVETPSSSRIAQWQNVTNDKGLIHLQMQLIDEPEEGTYSIKLKSSPESSPIIKNFKVEEYVLPRFELTVTAPKEIFADSSELPVKVCADYTFGQPVRGNLTGTVDNGLWSNYYEDSLKQVKVNQTMFGCTDVKVDLSALSINKSWKQSYRINLKFKFVEDGTDNSASEDASVDVARTAVNFDVKESSFNKPHLPALAIVKATYYNGTVAANEIIELCTDGKDKLCSNITTADNGYFTFAVPTHVKESVRGLAVNYRSKKDESPEEEPSSSGLRRPTYQSSRQNYIHDSTFYASFSNFYSPSNSSLLLLPLPRGEKVKCSVDGSDVTVELPLLYAANNTAETNLQLQIISRGQIQHKEVIPVTFSSTPLPDSLDLLVPEQKAVDGIVTGATTIFLNIKQSMAPEAHVLIWYTRSDGEVIAESRTLQMEQCLQHQVSLKWPKQKVEQGTVLPLSLKAMPNSICSLGIVDKSVELLSAGQDSMTVADIFRILDETDINDYEANQIDNNEYCKDKTPEEKIPTPPMIPEPMPIDGPIPFVPDEPIAAADEELPAPEIVVDDTNNPNVFLLEDEGTLLPASTPVERKKRSSPPIYPGGSRFGSDVTDAVKMFQNAGTLVLTNYSLETRPCTRYSVRPTVLAFAAPVTALRPTVSHSTTGAVATSTTTIGVADSLLEKEDAGDSEPRTYFPETWLWQLQTVLDDGTYTEDLTLPDTITEWVGKAVCVHNEGGVGLSNTASITTFTPFFVDLTVLPSIKKGEIMPVIISVFNYLETNLPVRVILQQSTEFELLVESGNNSVVAENQLEAGTFELCIPSGDKKTAQVKLRPLAVGDVDLLISATVDGSIAGCSTTGTVPQKTDSIQSPINVEFEGFPREKTWSKYICSEDLMNNEVAAEWLLEAPAGVVEESPRGWLSVVGDLMGPTLENLGNLIRMPYGCGEQNMLNFAPNIYVLHYLEVSKQINEVTKEKILRFMRSGYNRELTYKRDDGSYSAFGNSDNDGSTWLTAFVVKSFAESRPYITVDSTELSMSADWLRRRQLENGCFENRGKVLHKDMMGGLGEGKPVQLSSYVMIALLEAGEDPASEVIGNALFCLQGKDQDTTDVYQMAVKAYALSLARHADAGPTLKQLFIPAKTTSSGMYWSVDGTEETTAVDVETASYALLAMLNIDADLYMPQAHLVVKWMSEQRNSQGGFISTQDTVLALEAMALYESYQDHSAQNLQISATGTDFNADFKVVDSNKLLNQRVDIPKLPTKLALQVAGTGCALVQGVVRYNVKEPQPSEAFSLSVSTAYVPGSCKARLIKVCAKYLLRDGKSNMAIIEVNLVSGYIPDKTVLKRIVGYGTGIIKRYEVDGSKVMFYIDEFSNKETCIEVKALQEVVVDEPKPGTVKVYDYYKPELVVTEKYELQRQFCSTEIIEKPVPVEEDIIPLEESSNSGIIDDTTTDAGEADLGALVDAMDALP